MIFPPDDPVTIEQAMKGAMETEADWMDSRNGVYLPALTSIAVSLKRIADIMQRNIVTVSAETEEDIQAALDRLAGSYGVNQ